MQMIGPGMYTQRTVPCDECGGEGEKIDKKKQCKTCKGKKIQKEKKTLTVTIDKGTPHGEAQTFHGEANHIPDTEPGDFVVKMRELPHKIFKRKGADLIIEKEISLLEALTGASFVVKHLDGRKLRLESPPGQVIKPESLMTCEGQGMPFHKKNYMSGNLFVLFKIKFPESIQDENYDKILEALKSTGPAKPDNSTADETVKLLKFEAHHKNEKATGDGAESDEEEGGQGQGQRVQCQQQ